MVILKPNFNQWTTKISYKISKCQY